MGLKLFPGDNGGSCGVGGWGIGDESFVPLILRGMNLLRFVGNKYVCVSYIPDIK